MRIGSLVKFTNALYYVWDNKTYQWWDILCGNEIVVEFETYLKLVE